MWRVRVATCTYVAYCVHMTPPSTLAAVVTMALTEAGLSEDTAADLTSIRASKFHTGDFTYGELWKIADLLHTTPARIQARAEQVSA